MKNRISTKLAAIVLALGMGAATSTSHAADGYLVFNTAAIHLKNFSERNNITPGIGWEYSPTGRIGFHVGTLSDSFGYQAGYVGINYATRRFLNNRVRFMFGATALHKQYHKNTEAETKLVPFPVMEVKLSEKGVLNISGSPEIDYQGSHSNAVIFLQYKLNLR